jgi:hypothetical protein
MGKMGRTSKVLTPRNVELPLHVLKASSAAATGSLVGVSSVDSGQKQAGGARRGFCLAVWTVVLIMLTAAAVVIANFLVPFATVNRQALSNN